MTLTGPSDILDVPSEGEKMYHIFLLNNEVVGDAGGETGITGRETYWSWKIKDSFLNILIL